MKLKLYDIYGQLDACWAMIADAIEGRPVQIDGIDAGEMTEDAAFKKLELALQAIEDQEENKALNIACLVKNHQAEADALMAEAQVLLRRHKTAQRTADWLKSYLQQFVQPGRKMKDERAQIGWRWSQVVEVNVEPDSLPGDFRRVKVEADKARIKDALKAGAVVAGCRLVDKQNIQIK